MNRFCLILFLMILIKSRILPAQAIPEIIIPQNHQNIISDMYFYDNDRKIVTVSYDAIKLWDIRKGGAFIKDLVGHKQSIQSSNKNEESNLFVTSSSDSTIKIWDLAQQRLIKDVLWSFGIPIKVHFSINKNFIWIISSHDIGVQMMGEANSDIYLSLYDYNENKVKKKLLIGRGIFKNVKFFERDNFFISVIDNVQRIYSISDFSFKQYKLRGENSYSKVTLDNTNKIDSEIINDNLVAVKDGGYLRIMKPLEWGDNDYAEITLPISIASSGYYRDILKLDDKSFIAIGGSTIDNKGAIQLIKESGVSKIIYQTKVEEFNIDEEINCLAKSSKDNTLAIAGRSIYLFKLSPFQPNYFKKIQSQNNNIDSFEIIDDEVFYTQREGNVSEHYKYNTEQFDNGVLTDPLKMRLGNSTIGILDLKNFANISVKPLNSNYAAKNVIYLPNKNVFLTGDQNGAIKLWNRYLDSTKIEYISDKSSVSTLTYSPKYNEFLASFESGILKRFKLFNNKPKNTIRLRKYLNSVAFKNDENIIAFGNNDINILDLEKNEINTTQTFSYEGIDSKPQITLPRQSDDINLSNFAESMQKLLYSERIKKDNIFQILWEGNKILWGGEDGNIRSKNLQTQIVKKITVKGGRNILSIALSPNKKILAVGTGLYKEHIRLKEFSQAPVRGELLLYSYPELMLISNLGYHNSKIDKLIFSGDSKKIFSLSSDDGIIKCWNLLNKSLVFSFINLKNNNWIIQTSDNFYAASVNGAKFINFRVSDKIYNFDQFDLFFNRPDIVLERIGGALKETIENYKKAYQKRIEKLGFKESELKIDYDQPETTILENNIPSTTNNSFLKFNVEAIDVKSKLDRINVYVNDVPYYGIKGLSIRQLNTNKLRKEIQIPLSAENNKIEVSVHNQNGVESKREIINIFYQTPIKKPSLYVVSIGVSDYLNKDKTLKYAAKDASDIVGLFNAKRDNYEKVELRNLKNQDVTKEKVLAIKQLLSKTNIDDKVILFVSGHGILDNDKNDWYFASQDMDFQKPSSRGVSYNDLEGLLDGIPARNKLFLLDACHSGELDSEMNTRASNTKKVDNLVNFDTQPRIKGGAESRNSTLSNSFEAMKALFADTRRFSGANVISAASGDKKAFEGDEYNNGYFTYAFIDGIKSKKADKNQDGVIRVSELRDYIQKRVVEISKNKQVPTNRQENLANDFIIWTY